MLRPLLVALLFHLLPCAFIVHGAGTWETWENCTFADDRYFDGDSFQVKHAGKTHVLRLYYVDTPEGDSTYGERINEQAAHFGVTAAQVIRAGSEAKEYTSRFLSRPFRVYTRLQPAPGASRSERHYAIVERSGTRLDAALVSAGLARVTSETADYPTPEAGKKRSEELRSLEEKAAQSRVGLWSFSRRTDRRQPLADKLKPILTLKGPGLPAPHRVNLNTASEAELLSLPGVGAKTAAAIVAARPLSGLEALDAIPGIGPKRIEALRDLVTFK